jgi:hypothetical protein
MPARCSNSSLCEKQRTHVNNVARDLRDAAAKRPNLVVV